MDVMEVGRKNGSNGREEESWEKETSMREEYFVSVGHEPESVHFLSALLS